jgi:hypothetical protein
MATYPAGTTEKPSQLWVRIRPSIPFVLVLLLGTIPRQGNAQSNGCNIIPTTTPETVTGTFGGPLGVPAGTSFILTFAYASASNTLSSAMVTTSGGGAFGPIQWACTPKVVIQVFTYTTVVDSETYTFSQLDAGGSGAGFAAAVAPSPKDLSCSASLCGDPINAATGNTFETLFRFVSKPPLMRAPYAEVNESSPSHSHGLSSCCLFSCRPRTGGEKAL